MKDIAMTDPLDLRLLAGCAIVREAGQLARDYFSRRESLEIEFKGQQDVVSIADRAVEEVIRGHLTRSFPDDDLIGEEGGYATDRGGDHVWVIDPIDGTANFLRGIPYWSVALAYVVRGRTELAMTYDPLHDELFAARRGQGASRNGRAIQVSGRTDPGRSALGTAYTFKASMEAYLSLLEGLMRAGLDHRRLGSSALMLCHTADGRLDGCAMIYCSAWDVIGGMLLVEEAGGIASDFLSDAGLTVPGAAFAGTPALGPTLAGLTGLKAARNRAAARSI
jgi:myo-inositol-1(or 4)-monophosphatase